MSNLTTMQERALDAILPKRGWDPMDWSDIKLPPHIAFCARCGGKGQYEQTYTVGCGGGYYRSMGSCSSCDGTGLVLKIDNLFVNDNFRITAEDIAPLLEQRNEQQKELQKHG